MIFRQVLSWILSAFALCAPVSAQDVDKYVSIAPPAEWVHVHKSGDGPFELAGDHDRLYRLFDQQFRVTGTLEDDYIRDVTTLLSRDALDDYGTITISFNPAYQTIVLHQVHIRRASGDVVDVTEHGEMQLYRKETDREKLIYNGRLELAFLVPQLKQGDTLDFSYTRSGRNPALGPHWQRSVRHDYRRPMQVMHKRLLVGPGTQAFLTQHNGAPEPAERQLGDFTEYVWSAENVPGRVGETEIPSGFRSSVITTASSIEDWGEAGSFFAPLYDPAQFLSPQVEAIANDIRAANADNTGAQLRAALDYVQTEVRYTGVQLGSGGFVPRSPSRVLSRGFGDCKDMTVLLLTILEALGIDATPLLVNLDSRGGVDYDRPRIAAFDHVVVRATLAGKSYVLDPTTGKQLGDLEHVQQGDFGKGVIIAPDSPGMIDASIPQPKFYDDVVDTFDMTTDPTAVLFTSKATYSGYSADATVLWIEKDGEADVEEKYLNYFKKLYPSIEIASPLTWSVNEDNAVVEITTQYKLADPWSEDEDDGGRIFWANPNELLVKLPELTDESRKAPLALSHPVRFRHQLNFIMDETWGFETDTVAATTSAFDIKMVARGVPGKASKTYTYVTKSDHILPEDLPEARAALKRIRDVEWTSIHDADANAFWSAIGLGDMTDDEAGAVAGFYIFAVILLQLLVVSYKPQQPALAEMKQQILYPVSTFKFVVMSLGTMGIYSSYWFWQNWRWLREVDGQDVSPFWRGFIFSGIWNFSLFPRIATQAPEASRGLQRFAVPWAVVFLVLSICDQVAEELTLTLWFTVLLALAPVPFQREVFRKNEANGKWVTRNSMFGWQAVGALILWAPISVLMLIGAFAA